MTSLVDMAVKDGNKQFSVTLPDQAGEVARTLILTRLEQLAAEGIVSIRRRSITS